MHGSIMTILNCFTIFSILAESTTTPTNNTDGCSGDKTLIKILQGLHGKDGPPKPQRQHGDDAINGPDGSIGQNLEQGPPEPISGGVV